MTHPFPDLVRSPTPRILAPEIMAVRSQVRVQATAEAGASSTAVDLYRPVRIQEGLTGLQNGGNKTNSKSGKTATDPESVVTAFEAALNRKDANDPADLFADDAIINSAYGMAKGKEKIREFLQMLIAQDFQIIAVGERKIEGNKESHIVKITTDATKNIGSARCYRAGHGRERKNQIVRRSIHSRIARESNVRALTREDQRC